MTKKNKLTPREITERSHELQRRVHSAFKNGREQGRAEIMDKLRKLRDKSGIRLMAGGVDMTDIFFDEDMPFPE